MVVLLPILNIEGSPTALVPSSILLNTLVCKPRSMKVKYLELILDPEINSNHR